MPVKNLAFGNAAAMPDMTNAARMRVSRQQLL